MTAADRPSKTAPARGEPPRPGVTAAADEPVAAGVVGTAGGRGRRGYFLPGAIALVALLAIGGLVGAGDLSHPAPRTLTGSDVASQISLAVQTEQNAPAPSRVDCPTNEPVRVGYRFHCTLIPATGRAVTVTVTEVDGRGRLHWSLGRSRPST